MNQDRSLKFTVFMTNVNESMEMLMHGNIVAKYLTALMLQPSLMEEFCVYMEVFLQMFARSIKLEPLIADKRFPMRDLFAISCGQIQKTLKLGQYLLEVQAGCLDHVL